MLNQYELRIGNCIRGSVFGGKGKSEWIHVTGKVHSLMDNGLKIGDVITWTYDSIFGIELNKDIMQKCNFSHRIHLKDWYYKLDGTATILIYTPSFNTLAICGSNEKPCLFINCEYLHTLQNIIYSLTNKELKITW